MYFFKNSLLYKENSQVWDLSCDDDEFSLLCECLILMSIWFSLLQKSIFWTFWIFWSSEVECSSITRHLICCQISFLFWQIWSRASWCRFYSCCFWSKQSSFFWESVELLNSFCVVALSWKNSAKESSAFFWKNADQIILVIFNRLFFLRVERLEL